MANGYVASRIEQPRESKLKIFARPPSVAQPSARSRPIHMTDMPLAHYQDRRYLYALKKFGLYRCKKVAFFFGLKKVDP